MEETADFENDCYGIIRNKMNYILLLSAYSDLIKVMNFGQI